ncbi:putative integral membrane protein [Amycolatopsis endophytica]|uniref:Putative integral membrane protein n=1 Tax=Amycolatopsis endophytica TaxID=860233 RepID=A0A853BCC3_9PSEU|nr:hypothetical protein [Amycolatopsis endophytica]NYI92402.1 putative integral membrane protein [Amycolatopsis endophytica]
MAGAGFVFLAVIFFVSVAGALWPVRNPRTLAAVLLLHLAASITGFVLLAVERSATPRTVVLLVTFVPGFLIALFRLLLNTTEWGERFRS